MLAHDRRVLDIPWRNDSNHKPLISLLGPRQFPPLSIKASTMLIPKYIPVIKTSALSSQTRQGQNQPRRRPPPPSRQNRQLTEHVPTLIYSQFASDFSKQEPSLQRLPPTRQHGPPPRQQRPSTEHVTDLYSQFASYFSKQEPSLQILPPPRQHRPPTTPVLDLIYSQYASEFSKQELRSQRFQPTFDSSFLGAAAPDKSIGFPTSSTHTPA
jgi:hypothetical protein